MFVITNAATLLTLVVSFMFFFFLLITDTRTLSNLSFQRTMFGLVDCHYFMLVFYFISLCYYLYYLLLLFLGFTLLYSTLSHLQGKSGPKYQALHFGLRIFYCLVSSSGPSSRCFLFFISFF